MKSKPSPKQKVRKVIKVDGFVLMVNGYLCAEADLAIGSTKLTIFPLAKIAKEAAKDRSKYSSGAQPVKVSLSYLQ